jgi:hypothetical protein
VLQDTDFLGGGRGHNTIQKGDQTEAFQIYEDTNFLGLPPLSSSHNDENEGPDRPTSRNNLMSRDQSAVEQENIASGVKFLGS